VYESPVLGESVGFLHDKTEREGDDFANQDSKRDKETNLWKLGQNRSSDEIEHSNGFLKFNSSLGEHKQEKFLNKVSPSQVSFDMFDRFYSKYLSFQHEGVLAGLKGKGLFFLVILQVICASTFHITGLLGCRERGLIYSG